MNTAIDVQLLHRLELKIALEIKRICEINHINFFLTYGSLLGAVRHKGFIPWDDDLDIGMLRKDYDKFVSIFNRETNQDVFFMENWDTEKSYGLSFTKIKLQNTKYVEYSISKTNTHKGIFVDVFPFDSIPDNVKQINRLSKEVLLLERIYKFSKGYLPTRPDNLRQYLTCRFIYYFCKLCPYERIKDIIYNKETKYNNDDCKWVTYVGSPYNNDFFEKECLDDYIQWSFEGEMFPIPKKYDMVLTHIYGNYMEVPPVEEQVFRHTAIDVDFGPYSL